MAEQELSANEDAKERRQGQKGHEHNAGDDGAESKHP